MRESILTYFAGEKNAGVVIAILGAIAIAFAALFVQPRYELRAFAITLGIFGLIEIALGVGLFLKTDPQVARLLETMASDAARFYADETARMEKVQKNFVVLEIVWIVLAIACVLTAVLMKHRPIPNGIAMALLIHVACLTSFDIIAERRGAIYLSALERH